MQTLLLVTLLVSVSEAAMSDMYTGIQLSMRLHGYFILVKFELSIGSELTRVCSIMYVCSYSCVCAGVVEGQSSSAPLPDTWLKVVLSCSSFAVGFLLALALFTTVCIFCRRRAHRRHSNSMLYRETGKNVEGPVYEDIGPHIINRIHFELEHNEAYGHVNKNDQ